MVPIAFKTGEVAERTGASLRQLQLWDEAGLVKAAFSVHSRYYSASLIQRVRIVKRLKACHLSTARIKAALAGLVLHHDSRFVLYPRGQRVQVFRSADEVLPACEQAARGFILVEL